MFRRNFLISIFAVAPLMAYGATGSCYVVKNLGKGFTYGVVINGSESRVDAIDAPDPVEILRERLSPRRSQCSEVFRDTLLCISPPGYPWRIIHTWVIDAAKGKVQLTEVRVGEFDGVTTLIGDIITDRC